MPQFVIIGLAAGLACAALFASATVGGRGGHLLLFFLAPLPAFLAGLGWGPLAAAISAATATIATGLLLSAKAGLLLLVSHGLPAAYLCYLAQLRRTVATADIGPASAGANGAAELPGPAASRSPSSTEWYPVGRLVAASTLIAGALAVVTLLQIGGNLDETRAFLKDLLDKVFLKQLPGFKDRKIEEAELNTLADIALYAFPAAAAVSWLASFLLNLYLAGRITQASGRLPRPWPDLPAMAFPRGFGLLLAISLAVVSLSVGYPALVASGFAGALFAAYVCMGLAVVHELTRGHAARPFVLWGVYAALLILNPWAGLLLALVGVFEPILPWRRANVPRPPPGAPPSNMS